MAKKVKEPTESGLYFESKGITDFQRVIYDKDNKIATLDFSYLNNLEDIKRYQELFNDPVIIARVKEILSHES